MVRIAVIGAGQMGVKIAGEMAYHGHRVKIHDRDTANLDKVFQILEDDKKDLHENGLLPHKNFVGRVLCMSQLEEAVLDAEIIIEVIVEHLKVKQDIFERVSHCCKEDAIIASSTLRLDVNEITDRVFKKERTLGLRFLFPVYCIPEVEVNPGKATSSEVIEKVRSFIERMGKTLFLRSGSQPLILSEKQRQERRKARQEEILSTSLDGSGRERRMPGLLHSGNVSSTKVQDEAASVIPSDLDRDCAICMDRVRDCLLSPCHHMVTCFECGILLQNRRDACPICRKDIAKTIKVFHT